MNRNTSLDFDVQAIRREFPILDQQINNAPLIYFDSAATTQKPRAVIQSLTNYYEHDNANIHRGVHALSMRATLLYEEARDKVAHFINANYVHECVFVRGTTEAINLVAQSFLRSRILPDDEILITTMEHHSNIVPWQILCAQTGAKLIVAPISVEGEILLEEFAKKLSNKTKLVAVCHASNAIGTINPIKRIIEMAHAQGALVLIDGAQAIAHLPVDVQDLDCDFYAFSGHKMYGPTGIGILWSRETLLDDMSPYQGGGDMINHVSFEATEYAPIPYKFEAGTPNISGAIGLGAAIDYLWSLDMKTVWEYEIQLLEHLIKGLQQTTFQIIGLANTKVPVVSLLHPHVHAHDVGTILDSEGIAVRAGHHCTMPLMDFYNVPATTRISLAVYNTIEEIDQCVEILNTVEKVFAG
ncbi:MAG TPA: cysteine desulfurase [Legionellaceae bacterium]|nr:cysteine desulfurase [Legionellaceae bacterium]